MWNKIWKILLTFDKYSLRRQKKVKKHWMRSPHSLDHITNNSCQVEQNGLLTFDKNFLRTQIKCTGCWLRCVQDSHALLQSVSPFYFVFLCFLLVFYICIFYYLYFIIVPAALYSMQPRLVAFIGLSRTLLPRLYILKAKQIVLQKYYWKA